MNWVCGDTKKLILMKKRLSANAKSEIRLAKKAGTNTSVKAG